MKEDTITGMTDQRMKTVDTKIDTETGPLLQEQAETDRIEIVPMIDMLLLITVKIEGKGITQMLLSHQRGSDLEIEEIMIHQEVQIDTQEKRRENTATDPRLRKEDLHLVLRLHLQVKTLFVCLFLIFFHSCRISMEIKNLFQSPKWR